MANPRVHEIAAEVGVDSKLALNTLKNMGEFVKSASSSVPPPVARRLKAALVAGGEVGFQISLAAERASSHLPVSLPALIDALLISGQAAGRATSVLRAATPSGFFLSVGPAAAVDLAKRREVTLGPDQLAAPAGVAAVQTGSEILILSWRLSAEVLDLSLAKLSQEWLTVVERGMASLQDGEFVSIGALRVSRGLAILARLPLVIPAAPETEGTAPSSRSGHAERPPAEDDVEVRVIYLTRRRGDRAGLRDSVDRAARWLVRGHWREQWYPSLRDHRRVWIAQHEAGKAGAPIRVRRVVYALR